MNNKPKLSILMLSYNHGEIIEKSIKSIFDIQSKFYELELIIIDDGSIDQTKSILEKMQRISPIRMDVHYNEHEGVYAIAKNFNKLIQMAQGKYISFLASDDMYSESFCDRVSMMEVDSKIQLVFSNGMNVEDGREVGTLLDSSIIQVLESKNALKVYEYLTKSFPVLYIQGLIVRKELLKNIGGFDDDLIADDWVLNIKMFDYISKNNLNYEFINKITFHRTLHNTNTSKDIEKHFIRLKQVVQTYFKNSSRQMAMADLYWIFGNKYLERGSYFKGAAYRLLGKLYKLKVI